MGAEQKDGPFSEGARKGEDSRGHSPSYTTSHGVRRKERTREERKTNAYRQKVDGNNLRKAG